MFTRGSPILIAVLTLALAPSAGASAACVPSPAANACVEAGPGGYGSSVCAADTCLTNRTDRSPEGVAGSGTIVVAGTCTAYNYGYQTGTTLPHAGFGPC